MSTQYPGWLSVQHKCSADSLWDTCVSRFRKYEIHQLFTVPGYVVQQLNNQIFYDIFDDLYLICVRMPRMYSHLIQEGIWICIYIYVYVSLMQFETIPFRMGLTLESRTLILTHSKTSIWKISGNEYKTGRDLRQSYIIIWKTHYRELGINTNCFRLRQDYNIWWKCILVRSLRFFIRQILLQYGITIAVFFRWQALRVYIQPLVSGPRWFKMYHLYTFCE